VLWGNGIDMSVNAFQTGRALLILMAITGSLDIPGGTNPILTATRGDMVEEALRDHLEFTVVSDFFLTPTAELADLVLPAAHWLEQDDVVSLHKEWCVLARRKLAQIGETRDDRDVILDLAHRLGLDEAFPWPDRRAYLEWLLEPSGLSFEEFAENGILIGEMRSLKHEQEGFPTPSGRVELVSSVMARKGRPSLPVEGCCCEVFLYPFLLLIAP
jgi:anaerobic selenocysteine-containing dehydrogenase